MLKGNKHYILSPTFCKELYQYFAIRDKEHDGIVLKEYEVDHNTLSQYTGLKDKNGKMIFENDIVKWDEKEWCSKYEEIVEWDFSLLDMRKNDYSEFCEVIGNKFDNPELLEKVEE
jgi:hypothetical protein